MHHRLPEVLRADLAAVAELDDPVSRPVVLDRARVVHRERLGSRVHVPALLYSRIRRMALPDPVAKYTMSFSTSALVQAAASVMPAPPDVTIGNNVKIQIGFDLFGFSGVGTRYDGQTLNAPYRYEATNGTIVTTGGTKKCSNLYCHSDGTAVSTGIVTPSTSPAWDYGQALPCNFCHGNTIYTDWRKAAPLYEQDQPKSNSHPRHLSRFAYYPRGEKRQKSYEEERTCIAVDVRKSATAKLCPNYYFRVPPGGDAEFIGAPGRGLRRGSPADRAS